VSENFIFNCVEVPIVMSENDSNAVAKYLADHPRAMGILFTALLLLSQAGTVVAGNHGAINGP